MNQYLRRVSVSPGGTSVAASGLKEGNRAGNTLPQQEERRRRNPTLRKLVDGLLEHVRDLSNRVDRLSAQELEDAHQRFNWAAELMWATITDEKNKPAGAEQP
jgi:hypothetical protein